MLLGPKYIDPRLSSVSDFVSKAIRRAAPHERQAEVLSILAGTRDLAALKKLAEILPPRKGLAYDPLSMEIRSRQRLAKAFSAAAKHGKRNPSVVLDVGCARAENARYMKEYKTTRYIGLDIDRTHFPDINTLSIDAELIEASAEQIPLADNSVDLAISFNVFEHVPIPGNALSEIVRVLKPGGVFYTKFGPPFNAASGPHLTRRVDLPFMHHLFREETVAAFTQRENAYYTVNRQPLSYYREQFFGGRGFQLPYYREQIDGRGFWLLSQMPEIYLDMNLDELAVCAITAAVVKAG